MEISGILRPFKQGVKLVNPEIELSESFLSNEESVWNDSKGLSAEVFNKLKQGYRSFFIIASKGELEWARTSNLLSKYNNVNVSIYGRKQKIKNVSVSYSYRDYTLLIENAFNQLKNLSGKLVLLT